MVALFSGTPNPGSALPLIRRPTKYSNGTFHALLTPNRNCMRRCNNGSLTGKINFFSTGPKLSGVVGRERFGGFDGLVAQNLHFSTTNCCSTLYAWHRYSP